MATEHTEPDEDLNYSHDIRADVDRLRDKHGLKTLVAKGSDIVVGRSDILIHIEDLWLETNTGGIAGKMHIIADGRQDMIEARSLRTGEAGFVVEDLDGDELGVFL